MREMDISLKKEFKFLICEKGATLLVYIFLLGALSALAFSALKMTTLGLETSESYKGNKAAFYAAEVGLDLAVSRIIKQFEGLVPYTTTKDNPDSDVDGFIFEPDYRNHNVKYKITNPVKKFLYQSSVGSSSLYHYAHTYDIEAVSKSLTDSTSENIKERIRVLETPLVQYFIFYGQTGNAADLEIFPGPELNMWGRIHSNGNIYIGSSGNGRGGFETINLRNYDDQFNLSPHLLSASGSIFTKFKHSERPFNNNVNIKTSGSGSTFTPTAQLPTVINAGNKKEQEKRFNEFVLVDQPVLNTPSRDLIKRGNFYEQRAKSPGVDTVDGIVITGRGGVGKNAIEILVSRPSLTNVTALINQGESSPGNRVKGLPFPIIEEQINAFGDCREGGRQVDTTDIDINALERWYEAYLEDLGLDFASVGGEIGGEGIMIYASRSPDNTFTNQAGNLQAIRLVANSAQSLPQLLDETTIATDNPMYVQGNFNSEKTKGVALISDAFNILSKEFKNHFNCGPGYPPTCAFNRPGLPIPSKGGKACGINVNQLVKFFHGSETTVNAAVFSGNVHDRTTDGDGVHVYPRFHEYWYSTNNLNAIFRGLGEPSALNILGSFVNLWTSEQAKSEWCRAGGDCYSAPQRNWGWDVRFQDPKFWPPFIPSIVSVERVGFLEK
jgi:hypothetical protein